MSSLQAFTVAVELAERRRDAARQALRDVQGAREAAQAQLEQLSGYAQETQNRWGASEGRTLKPEVMAHHYHFMGRLDHAIGLQGGVVGNQDARVAGARQVLLQAELRLASLRKVLERRRAEQALAEQRREQKQTDERAALRLRATYDEQG
ncbi:flagellar export protein FliJ [Pulveribacter sp.]|uniref:flagellar export protein FliJ n=1 Tax=Pulveribacter sp. TaxID=2678893 RepID=UPI0028AFA0F5|nr:flagellar export protein FliJ [Pulveribacter sp.]